MKENVFVFLGKALLRTLVSTVLVVGLVLFLIGFLPDFATFDNEGSLGTSPISTSVSISFFRQNQDFWYSAAFEEFGYSRHNPSLKVGNLIRRESLVTSYLFTGALILSLIFGALIGLLIAYNQRKAFVLWVESFGLLISSTPSFLLVPLLIYVFALKLKVFPPALWDGPSSMVLPIIALSLRPIFFLARLFSDQLRENSSAEYVKMAKGKGLRSYAVWRDHIVPNSLTAFIVAIGNLFGQLITGLFIIEMLFGLPGLGSLFARSLVERDYPVLTALIMVFTVVLQVGNRCSDYILSQVGATQFRTDEWVE